jgi:hypothetical protein
MSRFPCLVRCSTTGGESRFALGDPLVDSYLAFVAGRARANTLRAVAHDLKTFFGVVDKDPAEVVAADVFDFLAQQRGDRTVVRISDGEWGLSACTVARRLSSISGLYAYLVARGDMSVRSNPVPRGGLSTRRRGGRRQQVPLVRVPRTLPKIRSPVEVNALVGALRTDRDRAMVFAMVLGGLRRCGGPWPAPRRRAGGGAVVVHRRGQGRPPTRDPDLQHVLRCGRRLPAWRTTPGCGHGPGVCDVEGPDAGPATQR